jgi:3-oxoacyl-[acyl-carrier protein] reductase
MKILVTGGASGLGEAITKSFAADAADQVVFTYCNSEENSRRLENLYPNAKGIRCDFRNPEEVAMLAKKIIELDPDVLVNNAFSEPIHKQHFQKLPGAVFTRGFMHTVMPVIELSQAAVAAFRKKKAGKIITVLSSAILQKPPIGWSEYTAAKAYLQSICKSIAAENGAFNISSYAVSPSLLKTKLTSDIDERIMEEIALNSPLGRLLTTDEVADTIYRIAKTSDYASGSNIALNAVTDAS